MRWMRVFFCWAAIGVSLSHADVLREISAQLTYDTHVDGIYANTGAFMTQMSAFVARHGNQMQVFYAGDGYLFGQNDARSFAVNRIGIDFVHQLGSDQNRAFAGAFVDVRANRSFYNVYDYIGLAGYAEGKWYWRPDLLVRMGYHGIWRSYWNLDVSRYADHNAYAQINLFLPSRTALRADAGYGHKQWGGAEGQVVMGIQVSQSLMEHTGLQLRYQARFNTSAVRDDLSGALIGVWGDDDVLRDRYDYGGREYTARLTQWFPHQVRAVIEAGFETRHFKDHLALDWDGLPLDSGVLRKDRLTFVEASLKFPLTKQVALDAMYGFMRNRSNDGFYDYRGRHRISLGLGLAF